MSVEEVEYFPHVGDVFAVFIRAGHWVSVIDHIVISKGPLTFGSRNPYPNVTEPTKKGRAVFH